MATALIRPVRAKRAGEGMSATYKDVRGSAQTVLVKVSALNH